MSKAAVLLGVWMLAGCGREAVVRVMDGDTMVGRFIDERAYDAYLRGSVFENEGKLSEAEAAYQIAHETDPEGLAPLVRLAAVRCAKGGAESYKRADEAFVAAEKLGASYAPLYTERARCGLARGASAQAERDVVRALWLDPKDADTSVVYARILLASGKMTDAVRMLAGYLIWRPQAPEVWAELEAISRRDASVAAPWASLARPLRKEPNASASGPTRADLARIDEAIASGDPHAAHALAVRTSLGPAAVAVRAAALGKWSVALDESVLVLAADPWNADARAALLSLPDLEQARGKLGEASWARVMSGAVDPPRLSPLAALLLADALSRRTGQATARAFLDGYGEIAPEPADPLRGLLQARVVGHALAPR